MSNTGGISAGEVPPLEPRNEGALQRLVRWLGRMVQVMHSSSSSPKSDTSTSMSEAAGQATRVFGRKINQRPDSDRGTAQIELIDRSPTPKLQHSQALENALQIDCSELPARRRQELREIVRDAGLEWNATGLKKAVEIDKAKVKANINLHPGERQRKNNELEKLDAVADRIMREYPL